jgi:hypothetical protein
MRAIELLTSVGTGNIVLAHKRINQKNKSNPQLESGSGAASDSKSSTNSQFGSVDERQGTPKFKTLLRKYSTESRDSSAFRTSKPGTTASSEGRNDSPTSSTTSTPTRRPLPPLLVKKASVTPSKASSTARRPLPPLLVKKASVTPSTASSTARRPLPPMLVKKDSVKNLVSDLENRESERNALKELESALIICRQKLSTIESGKEAPK